MKNIRITTKNPEQIHADFVTGFKGVNPIAPARALTQADRFAPYRKEIMVQRKRGLSWQQIAEVMSRPPIDEPVSAALLKRVFASKPAAPKPAPAARPDERYVLDPLTGRQLPPSVLPK